MTLNPPTQVPPSVSITGLRLIAEAAGALHKVARIQCSPSDASVYIVPYVPPGGVAYAGLWKVPGPGDSERTLDFTRQLRGQRPKKCRSTNLGVATGAWTFGDAGPVFGRKLTDPFGGHVATIMSFDVSGLPTTETLRGAPDLDIVMQPTIAGSVAFNVALISCLTEEEVRRSGQMSLTLTRPGRPRPLFIAVAGRIPDPSTEQPPGGGVLVIAGWGPGQDDRPLTGVYVMTAPATEAA